MATSSTTVMYRLVAHDQGTPGMRKFGRSVDKTTEKTDRLHRKLDKLGRTTVRPKVKVDIDESGLSRSADRIAGVMVKPFRLAATRITPLMIAAVLAAAAALPAAGTLAAGALVAGFGLGLAGLAVVGAVQNKKLRKEFKQTAKDIVKDFESITGPIENVLFWLTRQMRKTWRRIAPDLRDAFENIAPGLRILLKGLLRSVEALTPALEPLALAFTKVMKALAPRLPRIIGRIAGALGDVADTIAANPTLFADLAEDILNLIPGAIRFTSRLVKMQKTVTGFIRGLTSDTSTQLDEAGRKRIVPFEPRTRSEKLGANIRDAIQNAFTGDSTLMQKWIDKLGDALKKVDWTKLGTTVGTKIADVLGKSTQVTMAVTTALVLIMSNVDWNQVTSAAIAGLLMGFMKGTGLADLGEWLVDGFVNGFENKWIEFVANSVGWLGRWLIDTIKAIFGISSPSTVFYAIGVDVVQGLINGMRSLLPGVRGTSSSLGAAVRNRFKGSGGWLVGRGKSIVQGLINGMNSKRGDLNKSTNASVSGMLSRWNRLRGGTRSTASYVVNNVMRRLVAAYNKLAKAFSGKTAHAPSFAGGGQVKTDGPDPRQLASGGRISGPGTGTSDSILARVSNGEYIVNARQTRKHLDLLRAINAGADGFAAGGLVGGIPWDVDPQKYLRRQNAMILASLGRLGSSAWESTLKRVPHIVAGLLVKAAKKLGFAGNIGGAMRFARAQDGKPYRWGGVGPGGYDCSGFMSAIVNVLQGRFPYSRRFTTGSFAGGRGVAGFERGARSAFMIGVNPFSHMAGTFIAGGRRIPVESGGRGGGVNFGPPADGAFGRSWSHHFGLRKFKPSSGGPPGLEGVFNARGGRIKPGQLSVVGERGPELVMGGFAGGGAVLSNRSSRLLARQGFIRLGQISNREWDALLAAGFRGDPSDSMEALYAPRRAAATSGAGARRVIEAIRRQSTRRDDEQEPVVIELHSGGTAMDDLLLQMLRKAIRVRGGNVQVVLGQGGR